MHAGPDSPPMNIFTSVMDSTSVSTNWALPPQEDRNGLIVYFVLVLKDVQFNTSDLMANTSSFGYTFSGLHEYTQYNLEIAAATSVGLGPFSSPVTFVTDETGKIFSVFQILLKSFLFSVSFVVPTAPPQLVSGVPRSSTLITFTWSPPPPLEVNGLIRYYIVQVTERHTRRSWTFFAVDDIIQIGSLHPYYLYDCSVSAYTIGVGPVSSSITVRTDQSGKI